MNRLKKLMKKPLSYKEVLKACNNNSIFVLYPDLAKVNDIDELLNKKGSILLLYLQNPLYGHWCCLNKVNNKLIEFFDPYGFFVDTELRFNTKQKNTQLKQTAPFLSKLLMKSPYDLSYNEFKFQSKKSTIGTCGRHCATRINYRNTTLSTYKKMFDSVSKIGNPDEIVTILTYDI